jgi:phosphoribosyl-AMP cyclohydrolase
MTKYLDEIQWNTDGLVCATAQDAETGEILMQAWMNKEALKLTVETGHAVYWSRSRQQLWHKGESSGNEQIVKEIYTDCDSDAILLKIEQKGGIACHTGRRSCFFRQLNNENWETVADVIKDPSEIYK